MSNTLPDLPPGFSLPFFYGTFSNIGFDYLLTDRAAVTELLKESPSGAHLSPAVFDDQVCLSFNYQLYCGQFAKGASITQEVELNIVAFPAADANRVPKLTYQQYAYGSDQTRGLGFCRMHVACDSQIAIDAGQKLFNEPKFKAGFDPTLPVPNDTTADANAVDRWKAVCGVFGSADANGAFTPANTYFSFEADLHGLGPQPVSAAPFTEYGSRKQPDGSFRPLAAPLNVFSPYVWYDLARSTGRVKLALGGAAPQGLSKKFVDLLKDRQPAGAWVYQSPPVAAQNRPYWVATG
ncbi:hypothetical protein [Streptacidiphilus albus]|uniref:hypothetical protein n=1 Tax=Streptacidiphilus albus TaxID=105425 RepID=UPI00054C6B57|nr:hypothetical protein [Streptacidiphilus albus]